MICLPRACQGKTAVQYPTNSSHMCCVELALDGLAWAGKGLLHTGLPHSLTDGYAMLMTPSKGVTAVHGCHCPRDMAVRMREVMARLWVGVCMPLALIYWQLFIHLTRACRGRTAVWYPRVLCGAGA